MNIATLNPFRFHASASIDISRSSATLKEVSRSRWPWVDTPTAGGSRPDKVMISRDFVVMIFARDGTMRLSISRTEVDAATGRLRGGISWGDLQRIKAEAGYGDWYAVEVFPPDAKVVDEQNMRHLWLLPTSGLLFGKLIGIN